MKEKFVFLYDSLILAISFELVILIEFIVCIVNH